MFAWDLGMQKLREEGPKIFYDHPDRHLDEITRPNGPRDIGGLSTFLSMKVEIPIGTLLKINPSL